MNKLTILVLVSGLFFFSCSGDNGPVIKIGRLLDENKMEVSEETDVFKRNDIFAYTLSQRKPFDTKIITRRFYQGKEYIDMIRKESVDISIKPGANRIGESIPVAKIIQKYGSGDYLLLFTIDETVIAKKAFVVEGRVNRGAKTPDVPFNEEIMPERTQNNMPTFDAGNDNEASPNDNLTPGVPAKNIPNPDSNTEDMFRRPQNNVPVSPADMMK